MKKIVLGLFICLLPAFLCAAIFVDGPGLKSDNGSAVKIIGVNFPYACILPAEQLDAAFVTFKNDGIKVVKILSSFSGDKPYAFQTKPGEFNEASFEKLDHIIDVAAKNGIQLIISLADSDAAYGGNDIYTAWVGGSGHDVFFKDKICREIFKKSVLKIIGRTNSQNGKKYAVDETIFAWDICNNAVISDDGNRTSLYNWTIEMSSFIKEQDRMHPVMISLKNLSMDKENTNSLDIFSIPGIDLAYYSTSTDNTDMSADKAIDYIRQNTSAICSSSGKPVVLSFGDVSGQASIFSKAAKTHFESSGSIIMFNFAAVGEYKGSPYAIDLSSEKLSEDIIAAGKTAANITNRIEQIKMISLTAVAEPFSAAISYTLDKPAYVTVLYGESLPLKNEAVSNTKSLNGTIVINNLKTKSKYIYMIKASDSATNASGLSVVKDFVTKTPERAKASFFKRSGYMISTRNNKFYDGPNEYKYLGANCYYLRYSGHKITDYVMKESCRMGLKVLRIGSNGEAFDETEAKSADPLRYLRIGPDVFNEKAFKEFDYVMESARRNNMRVIIHFTDYWEYYGGINVYAKWAGVRKDQFWTSDECKKQFKKLIEHWVNRKNTISGIVYKDDPVLFAWELCNEPWDREDQTGKTLASWIDEMAGYVKTLDSKHMVATGTDSNFLGSDGKHYSGSDFIQDHQSKNIDYCTFHIYPTQENNKFSLNTTKFMIDKWIDSAKALNKPVVMEEFGIPANSEYNRPQWIDAMLGDFYDAGGNGVNYWMIRDPSYTAGDGYDFSPEEIETVNVFIKYANVINKSGF